MCGEHRYHESECVKTVLHEKFPGAERDQKFWIPNMALPV